MTEAQEVHLQVIKGTIGARLTAKYRRGQEEHGGNLWERPALPELIDEVTDLLTYVVTLEYQLQVLQSDVARVKSLWDQGKMAESRDALDDFDSRLRNQFQPHS